MWPPLAGAIGQPELVKDPRFAELTERRKHSADLAAILSTAFANNSYAHWLKALSAGGITFGVISRPQDVPHDEQAVACGAVVDTAIPDLPRTLSNPIRLGFAEQRTAHPAPTLGQHSEEILREVGLDSREIAALKSTGAVK
jgi:formyl-CoA transferase